MVVPQTSLLLTSLNPAVFGNFSFSGVKSTYLGNNTASLNLHETFLLQLQLSVYTSQISSLTVSQQTTNADLYQYTAPPSILAVGSYSWVDLGIADDGSPLPYLTNDGCALFLASLSSQASIKAYLIAELAKALPVASTAISINSDIKCSNALPLQVRGDQKANFNVSGLQITTRYTLFSISAIYVTYLNTSVNHALQPTETNAPLSLARVRNALEEALRRVYLGTLQTHYGLPT